MNKSENLGQGKLGGQLRSLRAENAYPRCHSVLNWGEKWKAFCDRHADWGRDLALWYGRRYAGLRLWELGERAGGPTPIKNPNLSPS